MEKRRGWVVGRIAGAPVLLKPSALLMVGVLTLLFVPTVRTVSPELGSQTLLGAFVVVVMLMLSVFLHELAHAVAARAQGMVVQELALTLWGGHTAYSDTRSTPRSSAVIAVVGPLTNVVLAALAWFGYQAHSGSSSVAMLLYVTAYANAAVAIFNLLPGLPLDGGQVTESVVWAVTGSRLRGTVAAAWTGRVLAVALVVAAIAVPTLSGYRVELLVVVWAAIIGSFMWTSASAALTQSRRRATIDALDPRLLARPAVAVSADVTVEQARGIARLLGPGTTQVQLVLVAGPQPESGVAVGQPVGLVDHDALAAVPDDAARTAPVWTVSVALPTVAVVGAGLTGADLFTAVLHAAPHAPVCVLVHDGDVVGALHATDVARAI